MGCEPLGENMKRQKVDIDYFKVILILVSILFGAKALSGVKYLRSTDKMYTGSCQKFVVAYTDSAGNITARSSEAKGEVYLSNYGNGSFFKDPICTDPIEDNKVTILPGSTTASFYFYDEEPEVAIVRVSMDGSKKPKVFQDKGVQVIDIQYAGLRKPSSVKSLKKSSAALGSELKKK